MRLVYLYHSGFVLLGEDYTVVMDYEEDSVSLSEGVLHDKILERPGKLYVLSTHFMPIISIRMCCRGRKSVPTLYTSFRRISGVGGGLPVKPMLCG